MSEWEQQRAREKQWLLNLKPGDEVAIFRHRFGGGSYADFYTVDRCTNTQVIVNGVRYRKENGRQVGGGGYYHCLRIVEPTEQLKKDCADTKERGNLVNQLERIEWSNQDIVLLRAVAALLPEPPK